MAGVNKVILVGNLGRDPESRTFANGDKVVNFTLATSETWNDKATGERKEKTEWHKVAIFNERIATIAENWLRKGSKVYVEGSLQTRQWTDQSGQERYTTEVVISRFKGDLTLLDRKSDNAEDGSGSVNPQARFNGTGYTGRSAPAPVASGKSLADDLDDSVPF